MKTEYPDTIKKPGHARNRPRTLCSIREYRQFARLVLACFFVA